MFVFRHKNQLQFRPDLITSPCASSILPPPPSAPQNVCGEMKQTPLRLLQLFYYYYYYFHMNLFWVFFVVHFFYTSEPHFHVTHPMCVVEEIKLSYKRRFFFLEVGEKRTDVRL